MPFPAARLAACAAAAALAMLCVASGADRAGLNVPLIEVLPASWRGGLPRRQSAADFATGRYQDAATAARRAILSDPVHAASTAALGAAELAGGDAAAAQAAFRVAGGLGWREPRTQLYWLASALRIDQHGIAAQRLDALLRAGADDDATRAAIAVLEASPPGRIALAGRVAGAPGWTTRYTEALGGLRGVALRRRLAVLRQAADGGFMVDCERIGPSAATILESGDVAAAGDLWYGFCAARPRGNLLANGDFERPPAAGTPFDWRLVTEAGVESAIVSAPADGRQALTGANATSVTQTVAAQDVALAPGRYRFGGRLGGSMRASVACLAERDGVLRPGAPILAAATLPATFSVPAQGCTAGRVALTVSPGGSGVAGTADDLRVIRLAGDAPG